MHSENTGSGSNLSVAAQGTTVSIDPWAHRSEGMRCITCMWFAPKGQIPAAGRFVGRCRRHSPSMNGYPVVYTDDWCGDHKLNELTIKN